MQQLNFITTTGRLYIADCFGENPHLLIDIPHPLYQLHETTPIIGASCTFSRFYFFKIEIQLVNKQWRYCVLLHLICIYTVLFMSNKSDARFK